MCLAFCLPALQQNKRKKDVKISSSKRALYYITTQRRDDATETRVVPLDGERSTQIDVILFEKDTFAFGVLSPFFAFVFVRVLSSAPRQRRKRRDGEKRPQNSAKDDKTNAIIIAVYSIGSFSSSARSNSRRKRSRRSRKHGESSRGVFFAT